MSMEFGEYSGPVPKTNDQHEWYLSIDKQIIIDDWRAFVFPSDSIIAMPIQQRGKLLPCVGLGIATHKDLIDYLNTLHIPDVQIADPFHLQIGVDSTKTLEEFTVVCGFSFELEKFVQRLTSSFPKEVVSNRKVLLQESALFGRWSPWYKNVGDNTLTDVMRVDIRGTDRARGYIKIEPVMNMVRGQEYHAAKIIEAFPQDLIIR